MSRAERKRARGVKPKKKPGPGQAKKADPQLKTLDRVISKLGAGSRTEARQWIGAGRVRVNGKVVQTPDHWVDFERDKVTLDGKPLQAGKKRYVLLYKPKGYLTTYKDPQAVPPFTICWKASTSFWRTWAVSIWTPAACCC